MISDNLTDSEKLDKIKRIVDKNLFPIFTAFNLDLEHGCNSKLRKDIEDFEFMMG